MGRKGYPHHTNKSQVFAMRVSPELLERIRKAAAKDRRTIANWVECAIAAGVEKMGFRCDG